MNNAIEAAKQPVNVLGINLRHGRDAARAANTLARHKVIAGGADVQNVYNGLVSSKGSGGTMCASGSSETKTSSKYQKLVGASKAANSKKIVKKAQQGAQIAALVKKPIEMAPPASVALAAPTLTSTGGLPREIAAKQYAPLDVNEQQYWNNFVGYVDKAGYKGNPDLDVRDKGLSKQLFDKYSQENNLNLNYDEFIPRLQTHIKSQRDKVIEAARQGRAQIPGMVEYFDRAKPVDIGDAELERQFMSGLSKIDGWAGSKTTSYRFPTLDKPEFKGQHPGESVRDQDKREANYNMVGKHQAGAKIEKVDSKEREFLQWYEQVSKHKGLDPNPDPKKHFYDYRLFFEKEPELAKKLLTDDPEAHFTDIGKLPGHPTFSDESYYFNEENKNQAGRWEGEEYIPYDSTKVKTHQEGGTINVIVDGALHARKHELKEMQDFIDAEITLKGVPVITKAEGGGITQHAEVEVNELILRLEVTKKLEELLEEGTDEAAIEAGRLLAKEIVKNTKDSKSKILKTA